MKPILKYLKKTISGVLALAVVITSLSVGVVAETTNIYYVSPTGSDSDNGSLETPFKTLSRAAQVMSDGDECIVLPGTYYETLTINGKNNLKFTAQTPGTVTISGCAPISGWEKESEDGNIWVADMNWNAITNSNGKRNLVFQNGELRHEARWPNLPLDYSNAQDGAHPLLQRETYARVDSAEENTPTITDAALSELSGKSIVGASVWIASGVAYWSYLPTILGHSGNTLTLSNVFSSGTHYYPDPDNIYYIVGSKDLLDCQGEWYKDVSSGKLYFYSEEAPTGVEARKREYTIKVTNSTGTVLDGINARGGAVEIGTNTVGCSIKNATMETLDINVPMASNGAAGVVIAGENNLLTGCTIKNMFGEGVYVKGSHNRIINNFIHDINFEHTYSDGIYIEGSEHLVSHNTIKYTGRSTIGGRFKTSVISYNDLSEASRLSWDSGTIYFNANDYDGTEIHHNILHDSINNEVNQDGLYFDSHTNGMIVYKNLIYNLETETVQTWRSTMAINPNSLGNLFYNNTIVNTNRIAGMSYGDRSQTVFANNLFKTGNWLNDTWTGVESINNVASANCWSDVASNDYTLKAAATAAIDKGIEIPGVTDGYTGSAPDCGAFEYGGTDWTILAGHDFSNSSYQNEQFAVNEIIPARNLIKNQGFENAVEAEGATEFKSWENINNPSSLANDSWTLYGEIAKDGEKALLLGDGDGVTQTITGLQPNTTYELGGYAQVGKYVSPKDGIISGDMTSGISVGSAVVTGLGNGTSYIGYNVNFKAEYDKIWLLLKTPSKLNRSVKIRLDDPTSETVLADISLNTSDSVHPVSSWLWKSADLTQSLSGTHKIYVCFEGDFSGVSYGGLLLDDGDGTDSVTLRAVNAAGEMVEKSYTNREPLWLIEPLEITTNNIGTLTVTVQKNGGILEGYVDEIRLREPFTASGNSNSASFVLESFEVTYADGTPAYSIHKGETHKISGVVRNRLTQQGVVEIVFAGFDGDNNATDSADSVGFVLSANESKSFTLETSVPFKDGAYLRLSLNALNGNSTSYLISDNLLKTFYSGENPVFVKDYSVRNSAGDLITKPVAGAFNIFGVTLSNTGDERISMKGILAVYNEGLLADMMVVDRNIEANDDDWFYLGTVLPSGNQTLVKLFGWETLYNLKPIFNMGLFN